MVNLVSLFNKMLVATVFMAALYTAVDSQAVKRCNLTDTTEIKQHNMGDKVITKLIGVFGLTCKG